MNRKIYKELCVECDKRTTHVINVFNKVIEEYEANGKSCRYNRLLKYARMQLALNLQANKRMYSAVKDEFYSVKSSNKYHYFQKLRILYWLSSVHNYYVATYNTLVEIAKENGIIEPDAKVINLDGEEENANGKY